MRIQNQTGLHLNKLGPNWHGHRGAPVPPVPLKNRWIKQADTPEQKIPQEIHPGVPTTETKIHLRGATLLASLQVNHPIVMIPPHHHYHLLKRTPQALHIAEKINLRPPPPPPSNSEVRYRSHHTPTIPATGHLTSSGDIHAPTGTHSHNEPNPGISTAETIYQTEEAARPANNYD